MCKTAFKRGYDDFKAERHLNPFDYFDDYERFVSWIEGYKCAAAEADLEVAPC